MGLIKKLFALNRVTTRELELALRKTERESRRKGEAVHRLDEKQEAIFEKLKIARRAGRASEVDFAWEGLRQVKAELAIGRRQHRVVHLEAIVLERAVWSSQRLESGKKRTGVERLLSKLRASGLDDKLLGHGIREDEYIRELDGILLDASMESEGKDRGYTDPEKATFLAELDAIIAAEDSGDGDGARGRQRHLRERIRNEERDS